MVVHIAAQEYFKLLLWDFSVNLYRERVWKLKVSRTHLVETSEPYGHSPDIVTSYLLHIRRYLQTVIQSFLGHTHKVVHFVAEQLH